MTSARKIIHIFFFFAGKRKRTENVLEELMVEKPLNLRQGIENHVQEVQRSSDSVGSDIYLKTRDRDKVVA